MENTIENFMLSEKQHTKITHKDSIKNQSLKNDQKILDSLKLTSENLLMSNEKINKLTAESIILETFDKKHAVKNTENAKVKETIVLAEIPIIKPKRESGSKKNDILEINNVISGMNNKNQTKYSTWQVFFLSISCLIFFTAILVCGILYSASIFSQKMAESTAKSTRDILNTVADLSPRPIETLGNEEIRSRGKEGAEQDSDSTVSGDKVQGISAPILDSISSEDLSEMRMRSVAAHPDIFLKLTNSSVETMLSFDSLIEYVIKETKNPIVSEIFSAKESAPINRITDGFNIWNYIMTVRQKNTNKSEEAIALLEAASLVKYSYENGVPLALAVGVAQTESSFNPGSLSNKNACGPMQVVYDIHANLLKKIGITSKEQLFTADKGIAAGCYLLSRYLKDEKSVTGGLKRYYGALSPTYINRVLANRHAFELYATGIEKNPREAVSKESANWAKMNQPKAPAATATAKQNVVKKTGEQAVNGQQTTQTSTSQNMTIRPDQDSSINGNQTIYKNTGTIIIRRPDGTQKKYNFDKKE